MESWTEKYMNTLWFTTIFKAVTVIILMLLVFPFTKPYFPLLLTIEVGLVIIIVWALVRIMLIKNNMNKQYKTIQETVMTNASCPDYFTRGSNDKSETLCFNKYVTPDSRKIYYFMDPSSSKKAIDLNSEINIDKLFSDRFQNVCAGPLSSHPMYKRIPWTDVKPLCDDDIDDTFVIKGEEDESEDRFNFEYKLPKEFYEQI